MTAMTIIAALTILAVVVGLAFTVFVFWMVWR